MLGTQRDGKILINIRRRPSSNPPQRQLPAPRGVTVIFDILGEAVDEFL